MARQRPAACGEHHLTALDAIRETGICNMWGAADPLRQLFPELKPDEASDILLYWMETFSARMEADCEEVLAMIPDRNLNP